MTQPAPAILHQELHPELHEERRAGHVSRRIRAEDRRNAERVADDLAPRRHPEIADRRAP